VCICRCLAAMRPWQGRYQAVGVAQLYDLSMTLASGTVQVFKPNCDGKFAAVIVYSEIYQVCCAAAWAGCQSSVQKTCAAS
jgi:hypothetical protein